MTSEGRPGTTRTPFAAFEVHDFRWLAVANFAQWGAWIMETLIQGWLVLQLTNSPVWVGAAAGVRGLTMLLFSLVGGSIADRVDRRKLLIVANLLGAAVAVGIATLVLASWIELWHVLVSLAIGGIVSGTVAPTFGALTFDVVGVGRILGANSFYLLSGAGVRIVMALIGGLVLDRLGVGPSFLISAAAYGLAAVGIAPLRAPRVEAHSELPLAALRSGLRYAAGTPAIRRLLTVSLITETFGFAYVFMLPVLARDVLNVGAIGLGYLTAAIAVGALTAMLILTWRGDVRQKGRLLAGSAILFGCAVSALALSPWFALSLVLAAVVGGGSSLYDTAITSVVQVTVSAEMRGRVLGLVAATFGSAQLGAFAAGALASVIPLPFALALFGAVVAANGVWLIPQARHLGTGRAASVAVPRHTGGSTD